MKRAILVALLSTCAVAGIQAGDDYNLPDDHILWSQPVFESAYKIIATEEEWATIDTIAKARLGHYLKLFWKKRDPTPTTEHNEFKRQFEERVVVAVTRFRTVPRPTPWDPRGDVYIRFGPPDDRVDRVYKWYDPVEQMGKSRGRPDFDAMKAEDFGEIWYYHDRNLRLQFQGWGTEYELVPFADHAGDFQPIWDFAEVVTRLDTSSASYEMPVGDEEVDIAFDCYPFRRADGDYDVYMASAVPLRAFATTTKWPAAEVDYVAHAMAFDTSLHVVWSDSTRVQHSFDQVPRGRLAQNEWESVIAPGLYVFTVEIMDQSGKKHAVSAFDRWLVPHIQSAALELSPLVIAAEVRPASVESSVFVRNGKEIIPMPGRVFRNEQDVAFYHEVYNLNLDADSVCRYNIEYALYDGESDRQVLASRDFASRERDTFQSGVIPHDRLVNGSYILEVKTTDLNTGQAKVALARLKIE